MVAFLHDRALTCVCQCGGKRRSLDNFLDSCCDFHPRITAAFKGAEIMVSHSSKSYRYHVLVFVHWQIHPVYVALFTTSHVTDLATRCIRFFLLLHLLFQPVTNLPTFLFSFFLSNTEWAIYLLSPIKYGFVGFVNHFILFYLCFTRHHNIFLFFTTGVSLEAQRTWRCASCSWEALIMATWHFSKLCFKYNWEERSKEHLPKDLYL